jgi:low temperature requirement protein LtrA
MFQFPGFWCLLRYLYLFWSWIEVTFYNSRFETDDLGHRLLTLLQMAAAAFMAVCVSDAFGKYSSGFALSYAATRAILVIEYLRTGRNIPATRPLVNL